MNSRSLCLGLSLGILIGATAPQTVAATLPGQDGASASVRAQTVKGTPIVRGKVARMIYDAFSAQLDKLHRPISNRSPFRDVKASDSDYRAIVLLTRRNIATGDEEGNFHPNDSVSRYELAQALDRLVAELKPRGLDPLLAQPLNVPKDIPLDYEALGVIERMIKLGVVVPFTDGYFRGKRPTTDAEVADALTRIKELMKAGDSGKAGSSTPTR